jgi:hypothetical protein
MTGLAAAMSCKITFSADRPHPRHADRRAAELGRRRAAILICSFRLDPTGALIMLSAIY